MTWIIVGLGNPGEEYTNTRHNTGRMAVEHFGKYIGLDEWKEDKKSKAHVAKGVVAKEIIVAILPDTFMNKSGSALLKYVKSIKAAEHVVVAYDDMDLPLGYVKMSFDRGSGGHKGIESVARALKTKRFYRLRIGVSPETPGGKLKKPSGEEAVLKFILGKFKPEEQGDLKKIFKHTSETLEMVAKEGAMKAMQFCNSK